MRGVGKETPKKEMDYTRIFMTSHRTLSSTWENHSFKLFPAERDVEKIVNLLILKIKFQRH